jgi:hypothetical protein
MNLNKTRWSLLSFRFLEDVVGIMSDGVRKDRSPDWRDDLVETEETESYYFDACLRHLLAARRSSGLTSARKHFAAVASNAMILWSLAVWRNKDEDSNIDRVLSIGGKNEP